MITDEIERSAMQAARLNRPDPPDADLLDIQLYLALYSLYAVLYERQLTREQARAIKHKLIAQYSQQKQAGDFEAKLRRASAVLWRKTEAAGSAYAQNRTLENADRLWAAVLNLPEGSKPKNAGQRIY